MSYSFENDKIRKNKSEQKGCTKKKKEKRKKEIEKKKKIVHNSLEVKKMHNPIKITINYEVKTLRDLPKTRELMEAGKLKPNFSRIARELNCDRRTAKRYYMGDIPGEKRKRVSPIDKYHETIEGLLEENNPQTFYYKRVLWRYLVDNHDLRCAQSTFRKYISRHLEFQEYFDNRTSKKVNPKKSIRFETAPGEQAQIDWKENIEFLTCYGEKIKINVLAIVLSYSRFQLYALTQSRIQNVLISHLTEFFELLGGVPGVIVNDNLKTVMDDARTNYKKGRVNERFYQYSKDMGFTVHACIAKRPMTKGKVETQMKILDEIHAYQGKLDYNGLNELVKKINLRKNMDVHQGTGRVPLSLLEEEKRSLLELPSQRIRTIYKIPQQHVKVNALNMISYKSRQYSVPLGYQSKTLFLEVIEEDMHIYDNTKLITVHQIKDKKLNYLPEHYEEHLKQVLPFHDNIKEFAQKNLKKIGGYYDDTKPAK